MCIENQQIVIIQNHHYLGTWAVEHWEKQSLEIKVQYWRCVPQNAQDISVSRFVI